MKKIILFTMALARGGTEKTVTNLASYLAKKNEVTIVTVIKSACDYQLNNDIKIIALDDKNKSNNPLIPKIIDKVSKKRTKKLANILKVIEPDVVYSFLPEPTIRLLSLKNKFPQIKMIVAIRNHPKREYYYPIFKFARDYYYKKSDAIIIQDEHYRKYLNKNVWNKTKVIPNYVSSSLKSMKKRTLEKKIVTASRLEKQKNISLLIRAFSKVSKEFDDYELHIYGDGREKEKLQKLINKLNLNKRVFLFGKITNVEELIKDASIFVLPSNYEGMPNALLEAMALSLPVIVTLSTENILSIIENEVNGIIIDKNNQKMLTQKMNYLLNNPKLCEDLGKNAHKIKDKFKEEKILKEWESLI